MKKTIIYFVSFLAILIFSSFSFTVQEHSIAENAQERIDVDPFNAVAISVPAEVYLEQGSEHSVVIDADEGILEEISIEVKNDRLVIKPREYGASIDGDILINITSPEYEMVALAGSGSLFARNRVESEELTLKLSGSGQMEFDDLRSEETEAKVAGSGMLKIAGNAEEFEVSLAGSGMIEAFDFEVSEFDGKISGSGGCNVFVTGELEVSIAGSGQVIYKGNPEVGSSVAGSGKVEALK